MSHLRDFVFIIGAMKSGTTSLFHLLSQHPSIAPCRAKEPEFFGADFSTPDWQAYLALWDWDDEIHRYSLEASTGYTKAPQIQGVYDRISNAPIGIARFIYVIRHPLDRIDSQVRHALFEGWGQSLDHGVPKDAIDYSRYAFQLDQFAEPHKSGQLKIVLLDRLRAEPAAVMSEVCDFLEIDTGFAFSDLGERANTGGMYSVHPWLGWLIRSRFGSLISRSLPPRSRERVRRMLSLLRHDQPRWRLNASERARVGKILREDLRRLRDTYGVDTETVWPDMWD